ncbi:MAG: 4-oxalocrotonate tautomerase [Betaproteobacteria bacterium]|nr:4-oxalocrotonate tautomerase [Betaproteobacteria bacterium]
MPTIRVELMEGRTPEQKKELAKALTDAICKTLGSKPESVDIYFLMSETRLGNRRCLWSEKT